MQYAPTGGWSITNTPKNNDLRRGVLHTPSSSSVVREIPLPLGMGRDSASATADPLLAPPFGLLSSVVDSSRNIRYFVNNEN